MAEAFHQWVNNLSPLEQLYYLLFDPNAISCTGYYWLPFPPIVFIAPLIIIGAALLIYRIKTKHWLGA